MIKKMLITMFLLTALDAIACTGIIVGKKVSQDGSMIIARNEDFGDSAANPKTFFIIKGQKHKDNEIFTNPDTGFSIAIPKKLLSTLLCRMLTKSTVCSVKQGLMNTVLLLPQHYRQLRMRLF